MNYETTEPTESTGLKTDVLVDRVKSNTAVNMKLLHFHRHYEIYYLTSGERKYFVGSRMLTVNEGDVVLVAPNVPHKTEVISRMGNSYERILVCFKSDIIENWHWEEVDDLFRCCHFSITPKYRNAFEYIMNIIEKEYMKNDKYSKSLLKSGVWGLLTLLLRNRSAFHKPTYTPLEQTLEKSAQYIAQHYAEPLTLSEIAKVSALSISYFSKRFKQYAGLSFHDYLICVRIMNAEKFLAETQDPITVVAAKCGFEDSNYFAAVFKKYKNMTPLQFRKRYRC